mmetsp:Transcript_16188/g.54236  ORF Transcript_16188/g.54236 Transcript_16188/m.54236 type:complete len:88 (+) Transcript_16188:849-1112(+)
MKISRKLTWSSTTSTLERLILIGLKVSRSQPLGRTGASTATCLTLVSVVDDGEDFSLLLLAVLEVKSAAAASSCSLTGWDKVYRTPP